MCGSNVEEPLEEITACDVAGQAQLGAAATTGLADLAEPGPGSQSRLSRPCALCGAHFLLRQGSNNDAAAPQSATASTWPNWLSGLPSAIAKG
jgi:hypothetical protein